MGYFLTWTIQFVLCLILFWGKSGFSYVVANPNQLRWPNLMQWVSLGPQVFSFNVCMVWWWIQLTQGMVSWENLGLLSDVGAKTNGKTYLHSHGISTLLVVVNLTKGIILSWIAMWKLHIRNRSCSFWQISCMKRHKFAHDTWLCFSFKQPDLFCIMLVVPHLNPSFPPQPFSWYLGSGNWSYPATLPA